MKLFSTVKKLPQKSKLALAFCAVAAVAAVVSIAPPDSIDFVSDKLRSLKQRIDFYNSCSSDRSELSVPINLNPEKYAFPYQSWTKGMPKGNKDQIHTLFSPPTTSTEGNNTGEGPQKQEPKHVFHLNTAGGGLGPTYYLSKALSEASIYAPKMARSGGTLVAISARPFFFFNKDTSTSWPPIHHKIAEIKTKYPGEPLMDEMSQWADGLLDELTEECSRFFKNTDRYVSLTSEQLASLFNGVLITENNDKGHPIKGYVRIDHPLAQNVKTDQPKP